MNFLSKKNLKKTLLISLCIIEISKLVAIPPLHQAIMSGNIPEINRLLASGASMKDLDPSDLSTTLHYAVRADSQVAPTIVELCLDAGIDINRPDIAGKTPLHLAVDFNKSEIIPTLLQNGALLTSKDNTGKTPLFDAVENGNIDAIKILLDAGADMNISSNTKTLQQAASNLQSRNRSNPASFNNYHAIKKLLKFYGYLQPGPEAVKIRNTLFGQSVIDAYRRYIDQQDPILLAKILGIDSSEQLHPGIIEKAKKLFIPKGFY